MAKVESLSLVFNHTFEYGMSRSASGARERLNTSEVSEVAQESKSYRSCDKQARLVHLENSVGVGRCELTRYGCHDRSSGQFTLVFEGEMEWRPLRSPGFSKTFNLDGPLEHFQEVAQKCQNVERILAEQLPTLRKLAQKQE